MVISNDGTKDIFKPRLIGQFIKEKTGVNDEIVKKIQNRIVSKIRNLNVPEITTLPIKTLIVSTLAIFKKYPPGKAPSKLPKNSIIT